MTAVASIAAPAEGAPRKRGRFRLASPLWAAPAIIFLLAFLIVPLSANLIRSVTLGEAAQQPFAYYQKLLFDAYYSGIFLNTFKVSLITTVCTLIVGYPVAYFMVRYAGRWNGLILFCLIAPLLTSIIMRTFGWRVLLARRGLLNVWLTDLGLIDRPIDILNDPIIVYIGLIHVMVPFMVLSITAVLQGIDVRLEESARVLGAGRWQAFRSVTLPLSLDGIATGCTLVFVITNGSFLTMLLLGGGKVQTLSLLIYQQFNLTQDVGFAATMGNVLLIAAMACVALQGRFLKRKGIKE
ncbi:MAG TPA: ABC transporter permease [Bosea sp. (in: a-proteobacteria)]|jgi:putative spermidine/putrescine transport system permease protein|uniref:ABC transporter permease n=1 Tax=Bosea sp. (in: a-proteobacteria) TaxID=1871050 RepID=UPI002E1070A1|nr:ABC transporter permease [Bosea sp. (in: a-proteobacteria)]